MYLLLNKNAILQAKHTQHTENTQKGETKMYKVYEKLELRGIEPFNTLIGSFRYSKDAEIFLDAKQKETYDNKTVRKSFFIFTETD